MLASILAAVPSEAEPSLVLEAGYGHTCAVLGEGDLACWGNGYAGKIGDGAAVDRPEATPVATEGTPLEGRTVVQVAANGNTSCAVTSDGSVACWGGNGWGQLGDGTTEDRSVPTAVLTEGTALEHQAVTQVTTSGSHTCALADDGTVACWGANTSGQLGDGTTNERHTATAVVTSGTVLEGTAVETVSANNGRTCAVNSLGVAACWGRNGYEGALGDGTTKNRSVPTAVATAGTPLDGATVTDIATGLFHTCAATSTGTAACWGSNSSGMLGDGTTTNRLTAVAVATSGTVLDGERVVEVAAGGSHTCALAASGSVACWGYDGVGQLGNGLPVTEHHTPTPIVVAGTVLEGETVGHISGQGSHVCAEVSPWTIACWGENSWGQIGDGTTVHRPLPTSVLRIPGTLLRVGGANRFETATLLSQLAYPEAGSAGAVVLSRSDLFPDALSGGPLAAAVDGPVLITPPTTLRSEVLAEIERVLPAGETVYILGSYGALSAQVENAVRAAGYRTMRFAGANRFETSLLIAEEVQRVAGPAQILFVATGLNYPDALAAGTAAASFNLPSFPPDAPTAVVVLSRDYALTSSVEDYLADIYLTDPGSVIVAAGGQASGAVRDAFGCDYADGCYYYAGANRYQTATWIAYDWYDPHTGFGLATGHNFPDALTGAPVLAMANWPVLLVPPAGPIPTHSADSVHEFLVDHSDALTDGLVLGGPGAVSREVAADVCDLVRVSGCDVFLVRSGAPVSLLRPGSNESTLGDPTPQSRPLLPSPPDRR